jgi:hypothetical protein
LAAPVLRRRRNGWARRFGDAVELWPLRARAQSMKFWPLRTPPQLPAATVSVTPGSPHSNAAVTLVAASVREVRE